MVSSKKSSKSLIALVVMAILLVASIVLAATGAWFTASDSTEAGLGDMKFGTVAVAIEAGADNGVFHADGTTPAAKSGNTWLLVAGDQVIAEYTVTNSSNVAVYYVVTDGTNYYTIGVDGSLSKTANNDATTVVQELSAGGVINNIDLSFEIEEDTEYGDTIQINGANVVVTANGSVGSMSNGVYEIKMIQKDNLTDKAAALAALTAA